MSQNFTLSLFVLKFSLLFRFVFASFHFFASKRKKILLPFRFEAKMMPVFCFGFASFPFGFASFRFKAKRMAVLCFRFALFSFEARMMANFGFFFVLFSLRFIFVLLQISMFRIDAKQAKKASLRFEAKMTAHPSWDRFVRIFYHKSTYFLATLK